ncbi:MAG: DUF4091 domain-containing protein [Candidatus Krumholzibacteriota bacterium]|nr:DUF4091 domain-containing protein [Candidatus Krumholzibacteriota bacterium]
MMTRKSGARLAVLLLAALAPAAGHADAGAPAVHVLSCLAKPAPRPPSESFLAQFETPPALHAAWGEAEALQLLVVAPEEGLSDLRVRVGEFTHESGDAWAPGAVTAAFVGFVETREPYYGTLRVGAWPDPILPDSAVDVAGGRAQPVWVEVHVPLDAEAGRYTGRLDLSAAGWSFSLPLEVVVWGFDLPGRTTLPGSFLLWPKFVYQRHGLGPNTPDADAMVRRYHELMLAHHLQPTYSTMDLKSTRPDLRINAAGTLRRADFTAFDEQTEWLLARGQTAFGLEGPRKVNASNETWYRVVGEHLAERGWSGRFFTYLVDESFEGVAELTGMVRRAAPGLANLITRLPTEGYPAVDRWCPRLGDAVMYADSVEAFLARAGKGRADLWVYTAGNAGSDVPALHLDVPGIEARVTPLAVWREGFGGLLFWAVNHWTVDPWTDPMVYPRQNGNGSLLYPGADGPVASQRLKLLRDGFEDVDYAELLRESDDPLAARVLAALPVASAVDWDRDARVLMAWRLAAGYLLGGEPHLARTYVDELAALRGGDVSRGRPLLDESDPSKGWHGGRDVEVAVKPDGRRVLRVTLDEGKHKLWRLPQPRDWRTHRELLLAVTLVDGDPVRLGLKLGSGVIRRQGWTWELHMAPGARRLVSVPIPHERLGTGALTELSLFVWEPESPRRFEIEGIWLR